MVWNAKNWNSLLITGCCWFWPILYPDSVIISYHIEFHPIQSIKRSNGGNVNQSLGVNHTYNRNLRKAQTSVHGRFLKVTQIQYGATLLCDIFWEKNIETSEQWKLSITGFIFFFNVLDHLEIIFFFLCKFGQLDFSWWRQTSQKVQGHWFFAISYPNGLNCVKKTWNRRSRIFTGRQRKFK